MNRLPDNKEMKTANRDFRAQQPCPVPVMAPYTPVGSKEEPVPQVTGTVPPLTILFVRNESKTTQTTVIRHGAKWPTPKHHMTPEDLPAVLHNSQQMPLTCWACDPKAPTTPWPVLHLIACHHTHPTTHLPPQAYVWVAPWFYQSDASQKVAWHPDHEPQWLFTTTPTWSRPDPRGIAVSYTMHEPGRTGTHEHPYSPLNHTWHTPKQLTQTLRCRGLNPDTAYTLHYIYSYLTQGQQE